MIGERIVRLRRARLPADAAAPKRHLASSARQSSLIFIPLRLGVFAGFCFPRRFRQVLREFGTAVKNFQCQSAEFGEFYGYEFATAGYSSRNRRYGSGFR